MCAHFGNHDLALSLDSLHKALFAPLVVKLGFNELMLPGKEVPVAGIDVRHSRRRALPNQPVTVWNFSVCVRKLHIARKFTHDDGGEGFCSRRLHLLD